MSCWPKTDLTSQLRISIPGSFTGSPCWTRVWAAASPPLTQLIFINSSWQYLTRAQHWLCTLPPRRSGWEKIISVPWILWTNGSALCRFTSVWRKSTASHAWAWGDSPGSWFPSLSAFVFLILIFCYVLFYNIVTWIALFSAILILLC